MRKVVLFLLLMAFVGLNNASAQQDVSKMTKEEIMQLSYDDLLAMPFEDLLTLANKLGVSTDELFAMIMNKSVSSASKKAEDSFKSPLSSTVITKAEIRSYGISSIEEALRLIPGMIVQEKTNGMYDVHIRGLNNIPDNQMMLYTENSNTLMMIDGRIVHNYVTGTVQFDMLPIGIEDIERIEVVRGANSALYGPNAVTGVINIITEKPTEASKTLQGGFHMGTNENYVGDFALRYRVNKKLGFGITANMQYRRRNTDQLYLYPSHGMIQVDRNANLVADLSNGGYRKASELPYIRQGFSFGAIAGEIPDETKARILAIQQEYSKELLKEKYGVEEASPTTVEMFLGGLASGMDTAFYTILENTGNTNDMFDDLGLSRKTYGFNSYLNYTPTDKINFDFSFGYQQSRANTTPIGELPFSLSERVSKTGYVNLNASIYDLTLNVNYMGGSQDYQKGIPGFKASLFQNMQIGVEYDIHIGDLDIVPGLSYNYVSLSDAIPDYINGSNHSDYRWKYHDHDYVSANGRHLTGYLNGQKAELKDFAPSLRADYHIGDFRVIGAVRFDKTSIPDEWNSSYQVAANYSINENNLIRASFSTAMRSANMVNSNTNYTWHRDGLMPPDTIYFEADKNAPLAKIKNLELGYRWRPSDRILIDAEAYYSQTEDFGALKAHQSSVIMPSKELNSFMTDLNNLSSLRGITDGNLNMAVLGDFMSKSSVISTIKYGALPYKVKQMGFGVNIDWIISPKLIAKLNANVQQTKIDNYYAYNQNAEILGQLGQIFGMITSVPEMANDLQTGAINELMANGTFTEEQLMRVLGAAVDDADNPIPVDPTSADFQTYFEVYKKYLGRAMSDIDQTKVSEIESQYAASEDKDALLKSLLASSDASEYAAYFAIKYGVYNDKGIFYFGNSKQYVRETEDGHKHKATPTVYGMLGLIYKPTPKIDITAFGNYMGKRTYQTKYSSVELEDRFTLNLKVGYKPNDGVEVFFNGHNILNTKQREFPYADEIGGVYSVGLNFAF